jgi:hypothetical protein
VTQKFNCAPIANNRSWRVAVGRSSDDPNVFSHVQNEPEPADTELLRKANVDLITAA